MFKLSFIVTKSNNQKQNDDHVIQLQKIFVGGM